MNENNDCICPICLDTINLNINVTNTECGHKYHTKCFLQNIAFKGFECAYCRKDMTPVIITEEIKKENVNIREPLIPYNFHLEEMENYVFRGLRWLNQQNNNEDLEPEPVYPDYYPHVEEYNDGPMAPLNDVINSFTKANISNNQLIEYILLDYVHDNYVDNLNNNNYKKIYTKLRELDANYKNNQRILRDLNLYNNRNTNYYEEIIYEYQIPIRETNNII